MSHAEVNHQEIAKAYMLGFLDGWNGNNDRPVEELHQYYERGFIAGAWEKKERAKEQPRRSDP